MAAACRAAVCRGISPMRATSRLTTSRTRTKGIQIQAMSWTNSSNTLSIDDVAGVEGHLDPDQLILEAAS